jgi:hypothetical protein
MVNTSFKGTVGIAEVVASQCRLAVRLSGITARGQCDLFSLYYNTQAEGLCVHQHCLPRTTTKHCLTDVLLKSISRLGPDGTIVT